MHVVCILRNCNKLWLLISPADLGFLFIYKTCVKSSEQCRGPEAVVNTRGTAQPQDAIVYVAAAPAWEFCSPVFAPQALSWTVIHLSKFNSDELDMSVATFYKVHWHLVSAKRFVEDEMLKKSYDHWRKGILQLGGSRAADSGWQRTERASCQRPMSCWHFQSSPQPWEHRPGTVRKGGGLGNFSELAELGGGSEPVITLGSHDPGYHQNTEREKL